MCVETPYTLLTQQEIFILPGFRIPDMGKVFGRRVTNDNLEK